MTYDPHLNLIRDVIGGLSQLTRSVSGWCFIIGAISYTYFAIYSYRLWSAARYDPRNTTYINTFGANRDRFWTARIFYERLEKREIGTMIYLLSAACFIVFLLLWVMTSHVHK